MLYTIACLIIGLVAFVIGGRMLFSGHRTELGLLIAFAGGVLMVAAQAFV